ncbi:hypothetical protein SAMN05216334_1502 [Nitrosomonas ureae]|uniref:Uncharacterized protein n=1 Tax=Nitrosomonas ureae TaxID=44577 RepID=A0A1H5YD72_9PROT|nr:hypothetical protein SAMN05216334_1502 [Nitrosomonas ureae]
MGPILLKLSEYERFAQVAFVFKSIALFGLLTKKWWKEEESVEEYSSPDNKYLRYKYFNFD